jgi:hypothetical protein
VNVPEELPRRSSDRNGRVVASEQKITDEDEQQSAPVSTSTFGRIRKVVRKIRSMTTQVLGRQGLRKTEYELLRADWEDMFLFNKDKYGPDFDKYGSEIDGARRRSKRIAAMKLISYK